MDKGRGEGEGCKGRDAFRIEELKLVVSKVRGRLVQKRRRPKRRVNGSLKIFNELNLVVI